MGKFAEDLKPGVDLAARQGLQALGPKPLYGKRPHHAAIKQRPLNDFTIQLFLRGNVSHKTTSERITSACRILYFFDGQRGSTKWMSANPERAFAEENRCA